MTAADHHHYLRLALVATLCLALVLTVLVVTSVDNAVAWSVGAITAGTVFGLWR